MPDIKPTAVQQELISVVHTQLLNAQADRQNGYKGRNAHDVLRDMETAISLVEHG